MAAPGNAIDPIHQFELKTIATVGPIGNMPLALTQSSVYMIGAVIAITLFVLLGTSGRRLVSTRLQSMVELSYEFVAGTVRSSAGTEGMKFFPLVFSLFMFILILNLVGMVPYSFTVTSHIIITFALAAIVILTVIIGTVALCGSVYLLLGTNIGARLGFLVSIAGLAGWMMLMGIIWMIYGIGLVGNSPSWKPAEPFSIVREGQYLLDAEVVDAPIKLDEGASFTEIADAAAPAPAPPLGPVISGAVSSMLRTVTVIVCVLTLPAASVAFTIRI